MPQDVQSCSEHQLILKNVESLRAAVEMKATDELDSSTKNDSNISSTTTTTRTEDVTSTSSSPSFSSPEWQDFECRNVELLCQVDFFEKAFETQQKSAFASTTTEIEKLLEANKKLESVFTSHKVQLDELHSTGNNLIQNSPQAQELGKVKRVLESTDQRWNHVLCSLKGQAKFLESKLNAFYGFDSSLKDFGLWLNKVETTLQYFDDVTQEALTPTGSDGVEFWKSVKKINSEMDGREKILESLSSTGMQMMIGLETVEAQERVQKQLDDANLRWNRMRNKCDALRKIESRLYQEKQSKAFNLLLQKLIELNVWLKYLEDKLSTFETVPVEGDIMTLRNLADHCQTLQQELESKSSQVESYLRLGKQSLAKAYEQPDTVPEDLRLLTETVMDHLTTTESKWIAIRETIQHQITSITVAIQRLESVEARLIDMKQLLDGLEKSRSGWLPVDDILAINLQSAVNQARSFEVELLPAKVGISECFATVEILRNRSVNPSKKNLEQLEGIKERTQMLEASVEDRLNLLMISALKKIDPTNQKQPQFSASVSSPWKRDVTEDKQVPYYTNSETGSTHWNHPEMSDILQSLTEFDDIKFSAYRTAMKLRQLRKRLLLDRLHGSQLMELFRQNGFVNSNDRAMLVADVVRCLTTLFGKLKTNDSEFNVALAVDLALNWLLNVYDRSRTGEVWPMSVKVALLLMSSGSLEEKYRGIFEMAADKKGSIDEFRLSVLVQNCIQIPRQLEESYPLSASNVNATVRSCLEHSGNRLAVEADEFCEWMKREPQPLVWIAVLQRLIESEAIVHQAKCSSCKIHPIVGLRYRCLKCFNFDLCQKCFFLGSEVKGHEPTHPMQEYTNTTTSGEDVRDISKVLKNRFRSPNHYKKHPRLGYLPVESSQEELASESVCLLPQVISGSTTLAEMHSRLELYASRLAELERKNETHFECEDEHQLIGDLCHVLGGGSSRSLQLQSPMQIMMALDADQRTELDVIMKDLEEENRALQAQYDLMRVESKNLSAHVSSHSINTDDTRSISSINSDREMIAEANVLRSYKDRLENRMEILEDHNARLNSQLQRLRQILTEQFDASSEISVVRPSRLSISAPGTPSLSSSRSSLRRRGPPSYSSSLRRRNKPMSKGKELNSSEPKINHNNNVVSSSVQNSRTSLQNGSIENGLNGDDDSLLDVANVGKELDRLIDGITSYVDPPSSTAKEAPV